jgi:CBS domain-containing protein
MPRIRELLNDRPIFQVEADQSVLEVVHYMVDHNIGAVPVLREGELVGVFSERDLMKRVVAGGRSPGSTKVSEVMTPRPYSVSAEESVENCMFLMREHGFRHLPVVEGKELKGFLSLRDLLLHNLKQKDSESRMMSNYIQQTSSRKT